MWNTQTKKTGWEKKLYVACDFFAFQFFESNPATFLNVVKFMFLHAWQGFPLMYAGHISDNKTLSFDFFSSACVEKGRRWRIIKKYKIKTAIDTIKLIIYDRFVWQSFEQWAGREKRIFLFEWGCFFCMFVSFKWNLQSELYMVQRLAYLLLVHTIHIYHIHIFFIQSTAENLNRKTTKRT